MKPLYVVLLAMVLTNCGGNSDNSSNGNRFEPGNTGDPLPSTGVFAGFEPAFAEELSEVQKSALVLALDATDEPFVNIDDLDQIIQELLVIRATEPSVQSISATQGFDSGILVVLTPEATEDFIEQQREPWSGLGAAFQPRNASFIGSTNVIVLDFPVNIKIDVVLDAFESLPEVETVEPNYLIGDGDDICREQTENAIYFIFNLGSGDCPSGCTREDYYGFSLNSAQQVTTLGDFHLEAGGNNELPDWYVDRLECRMHLR